MNSLDAIIYTVYTSLYVVVNNSSQFPLRCDPNPLRYTTEMVDDSTRGLLNLRRTIRCSYYSDRLANKPFPVLSPLSASSLEYGNVVENGLEMPGEVYCLFSYFG